METLFLILIALVGAAAAFLASVKPIIDDSRIRGKILNFDEGMRHYFFLLPGDAEQLLAALRAQPEQETLAYSLPQEDLIRFAYNGVEADYRIRFAEKDGKTVLCFGRVAEEREKGNLPYRINAFLIKQFGAKPLDYRSCAALFDEEEPT